MFKRNLILLSLMLSGTLSGLVIAELSLDIVRGNPRTRFFSDYKTYFNYEPFRPFFRKGRDAKGHTTYSTQRLQSRQESFTLQKPPSLKRVIIIGESVAGVFAVSKDYLRTVLRDQIPSCDFEVLNCSAGGFDSFRIVPLAEEVVRYDPDLVLILMGNSIWERTFRRNILLSNSLFRYFFERSWVVRELFARFRRGGWDWKPAGDRNVNYRNNYEYIVRLAKARGIPVVLFQLPVNFGEFPPVNYRNFFDKKRMTIQMAMDKGDYRHAIALLSEMKAKSEFASDPYVYFMLGKAHEKLKNFALAKEMFLRSVSLDATPGVRCAPVRNKIIGEIAKKYDCPVVAIDALFSSMAPNGIIGNELIFDNCHWYPVLNDVIIQETVRQIYAYNKTHAHSILADNSLWTYKMPFVNMKELDKRMKESKVIGNADFNKIDAALGDNVEQSVYYFQCVYRTAPDLLEKSDAPDKQLLQEFAQKGYPVNAIAPAWYRILYCKGEMYRRNREYTKALACFRKSIQANPDQTTAYLLEGLTYKMMKDESRARQSWMNIVSRDSTFNWLLDLR